MTEGHCRFVVDDERDIVVTKSKKLKQSIEPSRKSINCVDDGKTCQRCLDFAAKGAIPIDESFSDDPNDEYAMHPPFHPHCRCGENQL